MMQNVTPLQAVIRDVHSIPRNVLLQPLVATPFFHSLPQVSFLKCSANEAAYVDIDEVRNVLGTSALTACNGSNHDISSSCTDTVITSQPPAVEEIAASSEPHGQLLSFTVPPQGATSSSNGSCDGDTLLDRGLTAGRGHDNSISLGSSAQCDPEARRGSHVLNSHSITTHQWQSQHNGAPAALLLTQGPAGCNVVLR